MSVYNEYPEFEMTILKDVTTKSAREMVADIGKKVSKIIPHLVPHEQRTASRL